MSIIPTISLYEVIYQIKIDVFNILSILWFIYTVSKPLNSCLLIMTVTFQMHEPISGSRIDGSVFVEPVNS